MTNDRQDDGFESEGAPVMPAPGDLLAGVLGFQVRLTHSLFRRIFYETFADLGITNVEFCLLLIIWAEPGCGQHQASGAIGTPPTVSVHAIKKLVERGLVRRARAGADRRNYNLYLTASGLEMAEAGLMRTRKAQENMLAGFTAEEAAALFTSLERVRGNLLQMLRPTSKD